MDKLHYYMNTGLECMFELKYDSNYPVSAYRTDEEENEYCKLGSMELEWQQEFNFCKPLMHPLSSLTKPITVEGYNGGEPFVPRDELKRLGYSHTDWITTERETWIKRDGFESWIGAVPWRTIQLLIKWRFWLFDQSEFGKSLIEIKD